MLEINIMGRKRDSDKYRSITIKEFCSQTDIDKSVISLAIKKGRIAINRSLNPVQIFIDHPKTITYLEEKEREAKETTKDFAKNVEDRIFSISRDEIKDYSQELLKKIKLQADIRKVRTQELAMRNKLIARKSVENFFKQLISVDNSIIRPLGQSISQSISDLLENKSPEKTLEIQELIDKEIYKALQLRHERIKEYLSKLKPIEDNEL